MNITMPLTDCISQNNVVIIFVLCNHFINVTSQLDKASSEAEFLINLTNCSCSNTYDIKYYCQIFLANLKLV